ncbi:hypothetical protein CDD81_3585 [Ophiocordyceps australis]|uniref:3'-5' exonuclease domain-containing protein n=1 Tax=Ophiocordyceps australis TaxID=1399860 RepID=A0A2C5XJJ7_9HYPO|nr:hypothetical protein CDD81_3585 [Ophiocordyceps australis]
MKPGTASLLWNPALGIRFSPRSKALLHHQTDSWHNVHSQFPVEDSANGLVAGTESLTISSPVEKAPCIGQKAQCIAESTALSCDTTVAKNLAAAEAEASVIFDTSNPPATSLAFKIPSHIFHTARASSFYASWSHELYQSTTTNNLVEKVKVIYCTDVNTMEEVCRRYFLNDQIIGFDLEWWPFASSKSKPRLAVSLIQIATPSVIALFHVAIFPGDDLIAPTFRRIMEDKSVTKAGVNILADCTRLRNWLGVETNGIFELSHLFKLVKYSALEMPKRINRIVVPLATQIEECFGLPLYKGQATRLSSWTRKLNQKQIAYAASDAYAGVQLYHVLEYKRLELSPCPRRPYHAELGLPILDGQMSIKSRVRALPAEDSTMQMDMAEIESDIDSLGSEPLAQLDSRRLSKVGFPSALSRSSSNPARTAFASSSRHSPLSVKPPQDPRVAAAETQAQAYRLSREADPETIGGLLREPPLKTGTVISYILDSIVLEKMPFDRKRVKTEILPLLHPSVRLGQKFGDLTRECQDA